MDFELAATHWGIYPLILIAPFIQEDTAVVGAATAAISGADPLACYLLLVLGISASDIFKYGLGRGAHLFAWTRNIAARQDVLAAKERVLRHLGITLLIARFVPGTRIPLFIAAGLFHAPFVRASAIIIVSAAFYAGLIFTVFQSLGAAMGEEARRTLPIVALSIVALMMLAQLVHGALRRRRAGARAASQVEPAGADAYVLGQEEEP